MYFDQYVVWIINLLKWYLKFIFLLVFIKFLHLQSFYRCNGVKKECYICQISCSWYDSNCRVSISQWKHAGRKTAHRLSRFSTSFCLCIFLTTTFNFLHVSDFLLDAYRPGYGEVGQPLWPYRAAIGDDWFDHTQLELQAFQGVLKDSYQRKAMKTIP